MNYSPPPLFVFFFFNDTATTEIYTLSLHDALPICCRRCTCRPARRRWRSPPGLGGRCVSATRASGVRGCPSRSEETRLNSSHQIISYAVFCLKKKKKLAFLCGKLSGELHSAARRQS